MADPLSTADSDAPVPEQSTLTLGRIFALWIPLAASWMLMTVEYPIIQASISRLPDAATMLAAASVVIGLEITIEAPVIMLLATTTALARGPASFRVLRRFTIHLNVFCTVLAVLVAFVDPVFDLIVPGWMGIPAHIAAETRPALVIMIPWSAAIGWRRFWQGVLIRAGETRLVGAGTAVRLVFAGGSAVGLTFWGGASGVVLGACAWVAGVVAEAIFAHLVARATVRRLYGAHLPDEIGAPSYGEVARYHAPLAATSLLSLLAMPVLQAGIARMPEPEKNLAAWPVAFAILLLFRSPGFAWPEAVIALLRGGDTVRPLRKFTLILAGSVVLGLLLFAVSPLFDLYLAYALDLPENLVPYVLPALFAGLLIPGMQALQSWYRGVLMTARATQHVYGGMGIALLTTGSLVLGAVLAQGPGVVSAAVALTVGMVLESVYLARRARVAVTTITSAS